MVPYATTADHHPTTTELPARLQGPHTLCLGLGCPACLHTGLACAAWVTTERGHERRTAETFGDPLAHTLADLFDTCTADLLRCARTRPGDTAAVVARVARMVDDHCWALHGTSRAHPARAGAVAYA